MFVSVKCKSCEKEFLKTKRIVNFMSKNNWNMYCGKLCRNLAKKTGKEYSCGTCGKRIYKRLSELKSIICNKSCSNIHRNTLNFGPKNKTWVGTSYRTFALKLLENKCNRCNYKEYVDILIVHHRDRNRKNNDIKNLEILCPNCHMIEHHILNKY